MIDFRYHIVSIVAVFLALALGLFLGSTTLQGSVLSNITGQVNHVRQNDQQIRQANERLQNQVGADSQFLQQLQPLAVRSELAGRSVALVTSPGVDGGVVDAVAAALHDAGATVDSRVALGESLFDGRETPLLDEITSQVPGLGGVAAPAGAPRAMAELAAVLTATPGAPTSLTSQEQTLLSAFARAQVIDVAGGVGSVHPATAAVLLVPAPSSFAAGQRPTAASLLATLGRDLGASSEGVVVGGPASAATSGGAIDALTSASTPAPRLDTVVAADTVPGQITVDFALAEAVAGRTGAYGPGSSTPLPSPSPTS